MRKCRVKSKTKTIIIKPLILISLKSKSKNIMEVKLAKNKLLPLLMLVTWNLREFWIKETFCTLLHHLSISFCQVMMLYQKKHIIITSGVSREVRWLNPLEVVLKKWWRRLWTRWFLFLLPTSHPKCQDLLKVQFKMQLETNVTTDCRKSSEYL